MRLYRSRSKATAKMDRSGESLFIGPLVTFNRRVTRTRGGTLCGTNRADGEDAARLWSRPNPDREPQTVRSEGARAAIDPTLVSRCTVRRARLPDSLPIIQGPRSVAWGAIRSGTSGSAAHHSPPQIIPLICAVGTRSGDRSLPRQLPTLDRVHVRVSV
jgi:hypothetical protein